ncbi:era-like GTP-binding protein [Phlegmacium glaucopus]|nr:era-like GTP-binding protein [Phlegmacium glaucopus]
MRLECFILQQVGLFSHIIESNFSCLVGATSQSESTSTALSDDLRSEEIQIIAYRFRVLVIGRANAGKTTILQKVCNTAEQPEIFNTKGKKVCMYEFVFRIDELILSQRGMHNIENELVFKSNPRFIFHDSHGFEAGGIEELNKVKQFITERSKMVDLSEQLHVIWYCIPMDDERPFTAAELNFFGESGTGGVPVVAIFTKFDALEDVAYGKLTKEGILPADAVKQTADRAVTDFEKEYLPIFHKLKFPPKGYVYLRVLDMNKPKADCHRLADTVAAVLENTDLKRLFVSIQRNNLELSIRYMVER